MAQSKKNCSIENIIKSWESDKSDKNLSSIRASLRKDGAFDYKGFIPLVFEHVGHKFGATINQKDKLEKNNEQSVKLREKGNDIYKLKKDTISLKQVIELYTKSSAFAHPDSEEIAYSFSNRSAVLLHLVKLQEVVEDVERALNLKNCPLSLRAKLLARQGDCYQSLAGKTYAEVKFWAKKVKHRHPERHLREELIKLTAQPLGGKILNEECVIPELKNPSAKYPIASDALDVKYSKNFGRHIVAARDIKFGEVLVVEKTNFRFLSKEYMYTHCAYCLTSTITGVPCDHCVTSVYCSDKCKNEAWAEYHELECPVFDLLEKSETGAACVRLLIQMCSEAGGLEQLKERVGIVRNAKDTNELSIKEEWYCNSTLESILYLTTNISKISESTLEKVTLSVVRTLFVVLTHINFCGIHYDRTKLNDKKIASSMSRNRDVLFLGELLVELALIQTFGFYTATEDNCDYKDPLKQGPMSQMEQYMSKPLLPRGKVASPFVGLMNHSCFPNALMQHKRDHIVLYAGYPVKKGEQVFTSYGVNWCSVRLPERREACSKFLFTCTCQACKEDWPAKFDLPDEKYQFEWKMGPLAPLYNQVFVKIKAGIYMHRDLRQRDAILKEIQKGVETINVMNCLPCMEFIMYYDLLIRIYDITGNTGKLQTNYAFKSS